LDSNVTAISSSDELAICKEGGPRRRGYQLRGSWGVPYVNPSIHSLTILLLFTGLVGLTTRLFARSLALSLHQVVFDWGWYLDAPKEAGTEVECAEKEAEELEKAQF
jgi:hypothetical protein